MARNDKRWHRAPDKKSALMPEAGILPDFTISSQPAAVVRLSGARLAREPSGSAQGVEWKRRKALLVSIIVALRKDAHTVLSKPDNTEAKIDISLNVVNVLVVCRAVNIEAFC